MGVRVNLITVVQDLFFGCCIKRHLRVLIRQLGKYDIAAELDDDIDEGLVIAPK